MRVTVSRVLDLLANGHTREDILDAYPCLEAADIDAALAYGAWRTGEYDLPLQSA